LLGDLVRPWVVFNHGADKLALAPKISPQITEPEDLTALADNLDKLQGMGLELPEMWVRQKFGVPPVEKGEATLKRTVKPAPTMPGQIDPKTALEAIWAGRTHRVALEPGAQPSQPGVIEGQAFTLGLINNGTQAARDPMLALVAQVLEQVQAADGVDDLHDRLVRSLPDLDTSHLQVVLETALILGELAGMFGLRQGQG
jgi:phage gp29-like protein